MRINNSRKRYVLAAVLMGIFFCLSLFFLDQCGKKQIKPEKNSNTKQLKVVTTLFPYYDFLREIAGDKINLTLIVPAGMDSHSFEPTPADIITIQNADLVICNGGSMEQWLTKVLESLKEEEKYPKRIVTMMDYVEIVEEEIVEGMEAEEHHHNEDRHFHTKDGDGCDSHATYQTHEVYETHGAHEEYEAKDVQDEHEVEIEYDEHIWTSPVNAMHLVEVIGDILKEEDKDNREFYQENEEAYLVQLKELDQKFRDIVKNGNRKLLIFGDKFPLRYFFDEYHLEYRAAFTGCSTDTEPSAKTIAYLVDKVREHQIPVIYYLELSSHRVAEIIGEETKAKPLLFHSCHNVTRKEFDSGVTYLKLMEKNAINLRKGLE